VAAFSAKRLAMMATHSWARKLLTDSEQRAHTPGGRDLQGHLVPCLPFAAAAEEPPSTPRPVESSPFKD
jgi:hypothetical protein